MTSKRLSWLAIAAVLCGGVMVAANGCGDDDSGTDANAGSGGESVITGGKSGGGANAGKGGSGGKGGAGGKSGAGGSSGGSVTCGGTSCTVNSTLAMIAPNTTACCTSDDKCGQTNSNGKCQQQNAPGDLDSKCPTVDVDFMGMNYPQMGCCTPNGKCGGKFDQVGYGCLPREELTSTQGGPLDAIACGNSSAAGSGGTGGTGGSGGSGGTGGHHNEGDAGPQDAGL